MLQKLVTSRDPEGLHAVGLFEAVYNKSKLDETRAEWLNERRGRELQDGIAKLIAELSVPNQFDDKDEEVEYPEEYKGPKPIVDQIKAIAKIFGLDPSQAIEFSKNLPALESFVPSDALKWTGWFAIPKWQTLAPTYGEAVEMVFAMIESKRDFYNFCCTGQITPAQLRVHARTAHALDLIVETQKGDILIVAAQLGMRHRGKSVRRARKVFVANEFGLGSLAVGSIVLTHPERLIRWEEVNMDCPGDGFYSEADGDFSESPFFRFYGSGVSFDMGFVSGCNGRPGARFGSVSGFFSR